jgi:hypothetical protein
VKRVLQVVFYVAAAATPLPASAEVSVADAIDRYRLGDTAMFAFIAGNLNAWIWANAELEHRGQTKLFCAPPSVDLSVRLQVEITKNHVARVPADGSRSAGSVMLQSLSDEFPCK